MAQPGQPKESAEFVEWKSGRDRILTRYAEIKHYTETIAVNTPELTAKDARKAAEAIVDELDQLKVDEHAALRRYEMANPQPNPFDLSTQVLEGAELPPTQPLGQISAAARPSTATGFWPVGVAQSTATQVPQPAPNRTQ